MLLARPAFWIAVMFMLGASAVRALPALAEWLWLGWIVVPALALPFLAPRRFEPDAPPAKLPAEYIPHIAPAPGWIAARGARWFVLALAAAALFIGGMRQSSWRGKLDSGGGALPDGFFNAGMIADAPMREYPGQAGRWRTTAVVTSVNGKEAGPVKVRLSGPDGPAFRRGDVIRARVRRDAPFQPAFPGAFDLERWMERDGAAASLFAVRPARSNGSASPYETIPALSLGPLTSVRRLVDRVRSYAIEKTLAHGGERSGGMLAAMLFGYRAEMDGGTRDAFRRVGIGHVLAISGLHVMLVVGLFWKLGGWCGMSARKRSLVALVVALGYLGLSGGQVAAARATAMAILHFGGIALGRKSDMLNSLACAAFLITAVNPSAPSDISFQLSFTAVAFIHLAVRGDKRGDARPQPGIRRPGTGRLAHLASGARREAWVLIRVGLATWLGLFPIVMAVFHQINPIGLPINIVVIPWMSIVLACGLLLPWFGWIPGASAMLTAPAELLVVLARAADVLPFSSFPSHAPARAWLIAFYAAAFLFLLLPGANRTQSHARRAGRAVALLAMAAGIAGIVLSAGSESPPPSGRITALPGHSGDILVVESPSGEIAIVGTPSGSGLREANWLHFLRRNDPVTIIATTGTEAPDLSALDYHHGVKRILGVAPEARDGMLTAPSGVWVDIPDSGGARLALGRNRKGTVIWTAVECGAMRATATGRIADGQIGWRLQRGFAGVDSDLLILLRATRTPPPMEFATLLEGGTVAALGLGNETPAGWFSRADYGALVLHGAPPSLGGYRRGRWRNPKEDFTNHLGAIH
ncbi:MAG: ComEC family competence protein [Planctomycetota bacterium]|jgi:ComEC/Rec2-related protein|nr:ComEC family competence protein [Planctomycetota bacterium]